MRRSSAVKHREYSLRRGATVRYEDLIIVDDTRFTGGYTAHNIRNFIADMNQDQIASRPIGPVILVHPDTKIRVTQTKDYIAVRPSEWVQIIFPIRHTALKRLASKVRPLYPWLLNGVKKLISNY